MALSLFASFLFLTVTKGPARGSEGFIFLIISTVFSLPMFALAVSPWSENRRVPVFIAGVVMFISGLPFLLATLLEARVDWYFFTVVLIAACVMLFVSRHGRVPSELRPPLGWLGRGLLLLTIVFSPILTIFGMYMEEEQDVKSALWLAPFWLFFTGIAFKVISRKGLGLAPVKPLLFAGELSILLSIPLGFMLLIGGEEYGRDKDFSYGAAFCCAGVFSVLVFLRATIGSWLADKLLPKVKAPPPAAVEASGPPPLLVSKSEFSFANNTGFYALGGFALLGCLGLVAGIFVSGMADEPSSFLLLTVSLTTFTAPFWVINALSFFIGLGILGRMIYRTPRYWYYWLSLVVILAVSPFFVPLGHWLTTDRGESIADNSPGEINFDDYELDPSLGLYSIEGDETEEEAEGPSTRTGLPGHDPAHLEGNYGLMKIHLAVLRGDLAETKAQLAAEVDVNAQDELGNTPLHLALGLGETEIAEWLMAQDANRQAKARDGRTMAHAAAAGGQLELLKQLAAGGLKLDTGTALGQAPVHFAAATGQAETVDWLLGQGQSIEFRDSQKNTPLHLAVIHGRAGLAKRLVEAGADLKAFNQAGQAAIHMACATGQVGLVNWLIEQDAAMVNLPDANQFTPLYHAAINGNRNTIELLNSRDAKLKTGEDEILAELFQKVLDDDTGYFERFYEPSDFGGLGMGMYGMMPGMMPGMMSGMDYDEEPDFLIESVGVDEDGDGFDAYDELITDHVDSDPDDKPTQAEVDAAYEKYEELGWEEFKGTLTKNQDIINADEGQPEFPMPQLGMKGLNEEPMEEDPVASLMDNLTGVDADADGWDAFDELISDHSDSDPDDLPTQDEVDDALGKLDQLGWDEFKGTLTKNQDIINAPHEKPSPSEPQMEMPGMPPGMMGMGMPGMGMGMSPGMMGMGMPGMPGGQREPEQDEPSEEEIANLKRVDAYGNNLLHYINAIGSSHLMELSGSIVDLPSDVPNNNGITADELMMAFNPIADEMGYGGMGGMFPMGGMYGIPGYGMMPGMMPGMYPMGMNPMMMPMGMGGMYGMGMPMMGMNLGESIDQPLSSDWLEDLWSTEDSTNEETYGLEIDDRIHLALTQAEVRQDSFDINDFIGVDEDGDGWDAYDEAITGHSDTDPDDAPAQAEVDEAMKLEGVDKDGDGWDALEEKLAGTFDNDPEDTPYAPDQDEIESMLGLDVPGADSDKMTDQARLDEALGKVFYFYPRDELALRRVTIQRVIGENRQRSLFDRVIADDSGVWQRLRPTGLIHNTTDPRTGFSTLKWMELLNYPGDATFLAKDSLQDGANRRLQFRLSSTRTDRDDKSILHQFIRGGDKYEIAFAVSQTKGVDQRDQRGRTALHVAAALGSLDTVKVLLELGAAPAAVDDYGFNALHWAAQQGRMEVAKHLVEQAGLKPVQDRLHRTPAALAKANGHAAVSEYLEAQ